MRFACSVFPSAEVRADCRMFFDGRLCHRASNLVSHLPPLMRISTQRLWQGFATRARASFEGFRWYFLASLAGLRNCAHALMVSGPERHAHREYSLPVVGFWVKKTAQPATDSRSNLSCDTAI